MSFLLYVNDPTVLTITPDAIYSFKLSYDLKDVIPSIIKKFINEQLEDLFSWCSESEIPFNTHIEMLYSDYDACCDYYKVAIKYGLQFQTADDRLLVCLTWKGDERFVFSRPVEYEIPTFRPEQVPPRAL